MIHYLRYCCAMFFALISFLLAPPLSAQAQTRKAYVSQRRGQKPRLPSTTMHCVPPAPASHGASRKRKRREITPSLHGQEHGT